MPDYMCGFISGSCATMATIIAYVVYDKIYQLFKSEPREHCQVNSEDMYNTIPPVIEYTPVTKYEVRTLYKVTKIYLFIDEGNL